MNRASTTGPGALSIQTLGALNQPGHLVAFEMILFDALLVLPWPIVPHRGLRLPMVWASKILSCAYIPLFTSYIQVLRT